MEIKFQGDDKSYLLWLKNNPNGYVINTRLIDDPTYIVLHRASCRTIQNYPQMEKYPGGFTENNYIKICSTKISELSNWAKLSGRKNGDFSKKCGFCKPL